MEMEQPLENGAGHGNGAGSGKWSSLREMQQVMEMEQVLLHFPEPAPFP